MQTDIGRTWNVSDSIFGTVMKFPRSAGILLHISSLPGRLGIGDLGPSAREFAAFLYRSDQKIWQILPVCPPANGNSPYSSYSVFAGNADLISPEDMLTQDWGDSSVLESIVNQFELEPNSPSVDYLAARQIREQFFTHAFHKVHTELAEHDAFRNFCRDNAYWLDDFSLFEAIGRACGNFEWNQWPKELGAREPTALIDFQKQHAEAICFSQFQQFIFDQQWQSLKRQCNQLGIKIYGDLPIFVDNQSADVWAHQSQFQLDADGQPEFVAGVPPDYFSATGQKWGNPLYRWDVMEADGFRWWNQRFQRSLSQFDIIRVDHFRGFEAYWEIPAAAEDATQGQWVTGPGEKPFRAAEAELGDLPIVAEDLGLITEAVNELRTALDFPTMRVMQFGFGAEDNNFHRPQFYPEHCFAYSGTHDNETIFGWYNNQLEINDETTLRLLDETLRLNPDSTRATHLKLVQTVLNSQANTAIIPMQDYLGLGNEARMNLPATAEGNWAWKLSDQDRWQDMAPVIREMTRFAKR